MEVCRLCSKPKNINNLTPLNESMKSKFSSAFKIHLIDNFLLPKNVCKICIDKVENSFNFYQQVLSVESELKKEVPGNDESDESNEFSFNSVLIKEEEIVSAGMRRSSASQEVS